ncbi:MAG: autotransporter assembly complex protein TamA [Gammaproteobacteria bacterium]
MARHAGAAVLLLLPLLLSGCSYFRGGNGEDELEAEPRTGIRYGVEIDGEGVDDQIRSTLLSASDANQTISRPPASELVLRRRAEADLPNIESGLRSLGYYEGTASYDVRTVRDDNQTAQATVGELRDSVEDFLRGAPTILTYHVAPGPRYTMGSVKIVVTDPQDGFLAPTPEALKIEPGQPAAAQPVLDAQGELVSQAQRLGYAFAKADKLDAVIDQDTKLMDVTLSVTTGPIVHMGEFTIVGADHVDPRFLRRRVLFRPADRYHPDVMDKTRQSLIDTNLFSTVAVDQPDKLDATGRLPITYTVTERKPRSIGAGAGYATDEGPIVSFFWEHRNFLGAGEKFESDLYFSPLRQELSTNFIKPDVGARKHNLLASTSVKAEDTDAYESKSVGAGMAIERPLWSDGVTGSLGVAYRLAKIKPKDEEEDSFSLLSLPGTVKMDYSDNLLDPTKGWRLNFLAAPYTDTLNSGASFLKTQATATTYVRLTDSAKYILALRGNLGSIAGSSRDDIPADERFYAGGGGSIRGYGYQLAGPLNDDDDPEGGRSLIELSGELRYRMTDTIGLVYFIDGGTVADSALPSLEERLFIGTGIGLRYITPIGPLRLDVGVPVNRRSGIDDIVQVYVSIGQAY